MLFDGFRPGSVGIRFSSAGLGLAICRNLIEKMGSRCSWTRPWKRGRAFRSESSCRPRKFRCAESNARSVRAGPPPARGATSFAKWSPRTSRPTASAVRSPRAFRPSRTVSAHRPRQVDLPELRHPRRVRRALQSSLRRHESVHRRHEVRRGVQERHPLARLRVGRGALRERLLRAALRVRRAAGEEGEGVRRFAERGGDSREPRHGHDAGHAQPVSRSLPSRRISICCAA